MQLYKRLERNNLNIIKQLIKDNNIKNNNNIKNAINNYQINLIGIGIIFSYCCAAYLNFK